MPSVVDLAKLSDAAYSETATHVEVNPPMALKSAAPLASFANSSTSLLSQTNACLLDSKSADPAPKKWVKTDSSFNDFGFYAALYECGNQRVIAFRGTDDLFDGLIDDAAIAFGAMPPQVIAAFTTVSGWGISGNTYITGHSLGGALAILSACHFNAPAVTFNAPGVADVCAQIAVTSNALQKVMAAVSRCVSNSKVRNIRINGDPVSSLFTTGFQAGGNTQAYSGASCGFNALCRHGMATCLSAVSSSNENYKELNL